MRLILATNHRSMHKAWELRWASQLNQTSSRVYTDTEKMRSSRQLKHHCAFREVVWVRKASEQILIA